MMRNSVTYYSPPSPGICLYEFMCGFVPFAEDADDPYEIYEEIIKKDIQFPAYMKDAGAKSIMTQLLNKIPEIRLGGSFNALKANAWFKTFDWVTTKQLLFFANKHMTAALAR